MTVHFYRGTADHNWFSIVVFKRSFGCTLQFTSAELLPLHNFQNWDCRCMWAYSFLWNRGGLVNDDKLYCFAIQVGFGTNDQRSNVNKAVHVTHCSAAAMTYTIHPTFPIIRQNESRLVKKSRRLVKTSYWPCNRVATRPWLAFQAKAMAKMYYNHFVGIPVQLWQNLRIFWIFRVISTSYPYWLYLAQWYQTHN